MGKKFLMGILTLMLAFAVVGCNKDDEEEATPTPTPPASEQPAAPEKEEPVVEEAKYEDGIYYAENNGFHNDWKYYVTVEVADGKISDVEWNGANINGGKDKITLSADGEYKMAEISGGIAEWDVQAKKVEEYLIETQDPADIDYSTDDGNTDDIAGVTIKVKDFFSLVEEALDKGPVAKGDYKDGVYYAAQPEFEKDFKYIANIVVKNGTIVGVEFNAIGEGEDAPNKKAFSESGEYGMKEASGGIAEWHEQAEAAEDYLLETQDPTKITYSTDEGNTDDIAGVTMKVKAMFELAEKALADAK